MPRSVSPDQVEKRKLFLFTLNYFWMDKEAFVNSKNSICLLRSHAELPEKEYFLKFEYKTFLINLNRTKEDLFSALDSTGARYKIRKALKSGVTVNKAQTAE